MTEINFGNGAVTIGGLLQRAQSLGYDTTFTEEAVRALQTAILYYRESLKTPPSTL